MSDEKRGGLELSKEIYLAKNWLSTIEPTPSTITLVIPSQVIKTLLPFRLCAMLENSFLSFLPLPPPPFAHFHIIVINIIIVIYLLRFFFILLLFAKFFPLEGISHHLHCCSVTRLLAFIFLGDDEKPLSLLFA
jgi:hypothetical protein